MRNYCQSLLALAAAVIATSAPSIAAPSTQPTEKEWTMLVFLNGHNNLDPFGKTDINEMEKVGSTDDVNVVVQWASLENGNTKRLYVTQDDNPTEVTSTVMADMPAVDMGDYRNLIEFIRWGAEHYPAKKYFIDVWNHGSGWHKLQARMNKRGGVSIQDISSDDTTGHIITTEQLGEALNEASNTIGKKIEVYGSDACLMGMVEVAAEMSDAVKIFVGSQELEPGDGWSYDRLLAEWTAKPSMNGVELGQILTRTYFEGYAAGREKDLTMSAVNLELLPLLESSVREFGTMLRSLPKSLRTQVANIAKQSQSFFYSDYVDLGDFLRRLSAGTINGVDQSLVNHLRAALKSYTVANQTSASYANATGISIWIPHSQYSLKEYSGRYSGLKFSQRTGWGDTVSSFFR